MVWLIFKVFIALVVALAIYQFGVAMVKAVGRVPDEAEPEQLEDVEVRFECTVCGTRVTMTARPEGDVPQAPRHCMEEMALVADPFSR